MNQHRVRILHLSDLHLGKESASAWRMRRVLGTAWKQNLKDIKADRPIDLVCFTGDLAQAGLPEQYAQASCFVEELLEELNLPKSRFFCVPGNHDVNRDLHQKEWASMRSAGLAVEAGDFSKWMGGGRAPWGCDETWRDALIHRQSAYRAWLAHMGLDAMLPISSPHGRLGYRTSLDLGIGSPLHIVGFDSAWLAGDDRDAGNLRLTDEQIGRLLTEGGQALPGWTIAMVHHPLTDLADGAQARRLFVEYGVGVLLHGHLHDAEICRFSTPAGGLNISAAGCLYEHDRYPNSVQLLDLNLCPNGLVEPKLLWTRSWSPRGHWHNDDSLYPGSIAGRVSLHPEPKPLPSVPFIPGEFIGRRMELEALRQVLLPDHPSPSVRACVLEGMPGVGKTRLAEHFVEHYWMTAYGLTTDEERSTYLIRLALDPRTHETPGAVDLGLQLAGQLLQPNTANASSMWAPLGDALKSGPNGKPRLLLIENVDTEAQGRAVGELINHLPGCAILVTARYQRIVGAPWSRVVVESMGIEEAADLLLKEVEPTGHPLNRSEARDLARELGGLPLALHIAASHLSAGLTPEAFLSELRRSGLELAPAEPGDPRLTTDRARAILRSSIELSWRHWCGANEQAWANALASLSYGVASAISLSLASSITQQEESKYPVFAVAASRLSLLEYSPRQKLTRLHPLVAEFLRMQPEFESAGVTSRMSNWFMARLPDADLQTKHESWLEVWVEADSLIHWLNELPVESGPMVAINASRFAMRFGPFAAWRDFCMRVLPGTKNPRERSHLLWLLGQMTLRAGDSTKALEIAREKLAIDLTCEGDVDVAMAHGLIADILYLNGELTEALRIRQKEELPRYQASKDQRSMAVAMGKIADILERQGEYDEVLRIREQQLLTFQELSEEREWALTKGRIADVLLVRGELDEALRIRRQDQLPIYKRLEDVRSQAVTMGYIADILHIRGEWNEEMRIRREEQLPVYKKLGDMREYAATTSKIVDVLLVRGEVNEALRILLDELLPVFKTLGDIHAQAVVMGQVAEIRQLKGEWEEAMRIRRDEQLPVFKKLGDACAIATTMGHIADILMLRGELDEALRIRREQEVPTYEKLGDVQLRAVAMGKIADLLHAKREYDEEWRIRHEEEWPVHKKLGNTREQAVTVGKIARLHKIRKNFDESLRLRYEEQLPIFRGLGDTRELALTMGEIADVLMLQGRLDEALRIRKEEELPAYERLGDERSRAITMGQIADVLQAQGELGEALRMRTEEELPVLEKLGDRREQAIALGGIADLLMSQEYFQQASITLRDKQLPILEGLDDQRGLIYCRTKLAICLACIDKYARPKIKQLLELALASASACYPEAVDEISRVYRDLLKETPPGGLAS